MKTFLTTIITVLAIGFYSGYMVNKLKPQKQATQIEFQNVSYPDTISIGVIYSIDTTDFEKSYEAPTYYKIILKRRNPK